MQFNYEFLGLIPLEMSLKIMEEKLSAAVQQKKGFIFGQEHPLVYTAGIKTKSVHILKEIPVKKLRRGGSVTLHNPGQLVFYTVVPLAEMTCGLKGYIRFLENIGILLFKRFGLETLGSQQHTGIWTKHGKIGFIGLGARRGAVYHGMALNIYNDLADYDPILSCGLTEPITRLIDEVQFSRKPLSSISDDLFEIYQLNATQIFS